MNIVYKTRKISNGTILDSQNTDVDECNVGLSVGASVGFPWAVRLVASAFENRTRGETTFSVGCEIGCFDDFRVSDMIS